LGRLLFEDAYWREGFDEGLAVFLEGLMLFGAEKEDLAGEAVFIGVETGALLAASLVGPVGLAGTLRYSVYCFARILSSVASNIGCYLYSYR
jgi:hypothetical protein